ncbi:phage baseplate assembly protein V [Aeromonas hydrophila]|uniref:phage baseplate assembly protein V n=1 Tax=Aeromonas hydrophila TaxID=644 RepID=UPI003D23DE2F
MTDPVWGRHRAVVEDVDHPQKHYKARVRVLGRDDGLPVESLPWAECVLPLGTRENNGAATPVAVGDFVWVEFVGGDTRAPLITGGCLYAPGGVLNMPHEAFAGSESYQHKRTDKQPKPVAPGYNENAVLSLYGTLVEACKGGGFRVTDKGSGSGVEIAKSGQFILHVEAETFLSSKGDALVEGDGKLQVIVKGPAAIESDADISLKAKGKLSLEGGAGVEMKGPSFNWKKG